MTDAFDAVLGPSRGGGRVHDDEVVMTPVDRARRLVEWANESNFNNSLDFVKAERATAKELGLDFAHGHWEPHETEPIPAYDVVGLTPVSFEDEVIGLIETNAYGRQLLVYDQPAPWRRR